MKNFLLILSFFFVSKLQADICSHEFSSRDESWSLFLESTNKIVDKFSAPVEFKFQNNSHSFHINDLAYNEQVRKIQQKLIFERHENHPLFEQFFYFTSNIDIARDVQLKLILQTLWNYPLARIRKPAIGIKLPTGESIMAMNFNKPEQRTDELFHAYFQFLGKHYQNNLNISEAQFQPLKKISEDLKINTDLFIYTKEDFFTYNKNPNFPDFTYWPKEQGVINPAEIIAGFSIVKAKKAGEKLPLEILNNITVPRPISPLNNQISGIAEIGRMGAQRPGQSLEFAQLAAIHLRFGDDSIRYIVIEVDHTRKRLFEKFGFHELKVKLNETVYYENGGNYVLMANIDEFLMKSFNL